MELTYENMLEFIKNFYDMLPSLAGDEESARRLGSYFATDFMARRSAGPDLKPGEVIMQNREQRIKQLNGHADVYRAVLYYEPYPRYIIVDDRKKIAAAVTVEDFKHPVTGEVYNRISTCSFHELTLENNEIKIKRQVVTSLGSNVGMIP